MLTDRRTTFANNLAIGGALGRRVVGDTIDLENARNIGADANLFLVVQMSVTAVGATATIQVELVTDGQAPILVDGTATVHLTSPVIPVASAVAGAQLIQAVLPLEGIVPYERHLGVIVNVGTAALTAGSITAFLTLQPPVHRAYADGAR